MENVFYARRRLADRFEVPQVTLDQLEPVAVGLRQPGEVFPLSGEEVIEDPHALPGGKERPRQVRPDKPRPARHQILHPAHLPRGQSLTILRPLCPFSALRVSTITFASRATIL